LIVLILIVILAYMTTLATPSPHLTETREALAQHRGRRLPERVLARLGVIAGYPSREAITALHRHEMGPYGRLSDDIATAIDMTEHAIDLGSGVSRPRVSMGRLATFLFDATSDERALAVRMSHRFAAARWAATGCELPFSMFDRVGQDEVLKIGFAATWRGGGLQFPGQSYPEADELALVAQLDTPGHPTPVEIPFIAETIDASWAHPFTSELEAAVWRVGAQCATALTGIRSLTS
jgi:hypothetical protein